MHIRFWDTPTWSVAKEAAGGMGMRRFPNQGQSLQGNSWRYRRYPVTPVWARLAGIFQRLGHTVTYQTDWKIRRADLHLFCPSLPTLALEKAAIAQLTTCCPELPVWVLGPVASALPKEFTGERNLTVIRGEPEAIFEKFDDLFSCEGAIVHVGMVDSVDTLPQPDWSPFRPKRFRLPRELGRIRAGLIESARGVLLDDMDEGKDHRNLQARYRDPESIVDEMVHGAKHWGFRGFRFCDPVFGANSDVAFRLAGQMERFSNRIRFSIETRPSRMTIELLKALHRVGLKTVVWNLISSAQSADDFDASEKMIETARSLGIRSIGRFWFGRPDETPAEMARFVAGALSLKSTYSEFRLITPLPETAFFRRMQQESRIMEADFGRFDSLTPVFEYESLASTEPARLLGEANRRAGFRPRVWRDRWADWARSFQESRSTQAEAFESDASHAGVPRPKSGLDVLKQTKGLRMDGPHHRAASRQTQNGNKPIE